MEVYAQYCHKRVEKMTQSGAKKGVKKPSIEELMHARVSRRLGSSCLVVGVVGGRLWSTSHEPYSTALLIHLSCIPTPLQGSITPSHLHAHLTLTPHTLTPSHPLTVTGGTVPPLNVWSLAGGRNGTASRQIPRLPCAMGLHYTL